MNKKNTTFFNALPFLSVLPLNDQRLDLCFLEHIEQTLPKTFWEALFDQKRLEVGVELSERDKDSKDIGEKIAGLRKTFEVFVKMLTTNKQNKLTVGWPLILLEDTKMDKTVTAPLFLWKVDLKKIKQKEEKWVLKSNGTESAQLNTVLRNYLENRFGFKWTNITSDATSWSKQKIEKVIKDLSNYLKLKPLKAEKAKELNPCPNPASKAFLKAAISFSGVLSVLNVEASKVPKELLTEKIENKNIHKKIPPKLESKKWKVRVSNLPTTARQEQALQAAFDGQNVLLEGASSTGKTHSIAAFLPSVVADKGSCLMVSDKVASFRDILFHIERLKGLNMGVWVLKDDEAKESERFINMLERIAAAPNRVKFDETTPKEDLTHFRHYQDLLRGAYDALHRPITPQKNWEDGAGFFLEQHRHGGRQLLELQLDDTSYAFSENEYQHLLQIIQTHRSLFDRLGTVDHPLTAFQDAVFLSKNMEQSRKRVEDKLAHFISHIRQSYHDYLAFMDAYAHERTELYLSHAQHLEEKANTILADIQLYEELYGDDFDNLDSITNAKIRLLSMFSKRHQQIRNAKQQLFEDYEQLQSAYEQHHYFEATLPNIRQQTTLADFDQKLNAFKKMLQNWRVKIPKWVQQKVKELTLELPMKLELKRRIQDISTQLGEYLEEIVISKIIGRTFKQPTGKLMDWDAYFKQLLRELQRLQAAMRDFELVYFWKAHYLSVTQKERAILDGLLLVQPADWEAAFSSWYWYHLLERKADMRLPYKDLPIEEYAQHLLRLRGEITPWATAVTAQRRIDQIKVLKQKKDFLLKNCRTIFRNKSLKDMVAWLGMDTIRELFPVILTTTTWANSIFKTASPVWDRLVLGDAQNLEAKKYQSMLGWANQWYVVAQPSELPLEQRKDIVAAIKNNKKAAYTSVQLLQTHSKNADKEVLLTNQFVEHEEHRKLPAIIKNYLSAYLSPDRIVENVQQKGASIDILIRPLTDKAAPIALLLDGGFWGMEYQDNERLAHQIRILQEQGYVVKSLWTPQLWQRPERTIQGIVAFVLRWDDRYAKKAAPKKSKAK